MPWYEAAKDKNGSRVLTYEGEDPYISRYTTDEYGKLFISLTRKYYDRYKVQGYIEVKKSVKQVLSQALAYKSVYGEQVIVFDPNGKIVYPNNLDEDACKPVFDKISKSEPTSDFIKAPDGTANSMVTFTTSEDGFFIAIVIGENALYTQTSNYILGVVLLTIVSLVLAFFLSFVAANRITVPISRIYREMQHISLDGNMKKTSLNTRAIE